MRFNFDAYMEVYPHNEASDVEIESAVDTFKPTEEEIKEKAQDVEPGDLKEPAKQESAVDEPPEGENLNE